MGIPFEVSAKGVENASGSEKFGFFVLVKQTKDDTADRGEEAVKERMVLQKEGTKAAVATKRRKLEVATDRAAKHRPVK